ncbi:hypothetical protein ACFQY7_27625 [Actinomadura luteofluorescens]|uniref:hypothetical protein n=1 Tax=Actinomadura luteofluorescens TaxID=46163 RepID=UPI00363E44CE
MSRVTDGCATIAMSMGAGRRCRNPAMATPGSRTDGAGTAMSTAVQSGGVPAGGTRPF